MQGVRHLRAKTRRDAEQVDPFRACLISSVHHSALSETVLRTHATVLKQTRPMLHQRPERRVGMRTLIFGTVLLVVASVGFNHVVSAALIAARDAKAATFSERFAPALGAAPGRLPPVARRG
jgi:hypothetical protein